MLLSWIKVGVGMKPGQHDRRTQSIASGVKKENDVFS
jgi:hypothetical protein